MGLRASGRARGAAVAGLLLAATAVAGCDGGGDGSGGRGGPGGAFDPPTRAPSATGGAAGGVVSGPPLRFLPVEREEPGPCPSGAADAYQDTPTGRSGQAGQSCLHVAPAAGMTVRETKGARATYDNQSSQGYVVIVDLRSADAARFGQLTGRLAQQQSPRNRLAMVRGDKLLSAPVVSAAISGGKIQISGSFTRESAERLARDLGGG
ncbi:hypothetical protein ABZ547_33175 [Streptomyces sparsogenes]|uniref:SecDF P1 head subdomain-containing protein n=1 Tax=Streptomyces sparsogenes TaxID=67365 RepID=UPI0033C1DCEB